ncbi:MAG: hypothetical protein V4616_04390, partial [Bacteroidota bacterium]
EVQRTDTLGIIHIDRKLNPAFNHKVREAFASLRKILVPFAVLNQIRLLSLPRTLLALHNELFCASAGVAEH